MLGQHPLVPIQGVNLIAIYGGCNPKMQVLGLALWGFLHIMYIMLRPASLYVNELNSLFPSLIDDPSNVYYFAGREWNLYPEIHSTTEHEHQYVSIRDGLIVNGYFAAEINHEAHFIENLSIVSFNKTYYNTVFIRDFHAFVLKLFLHFKYNKICWSGIDTAPTKKIYSKMARKYGGRKVGTFKNNIMLCDGTIHDESWYEIMKEDFLQSIEGKKRAKEIAQELR